MIKKGELTWSPPSLMSFCLNDFICDDVADAGCLCHADGIQLVVILIDYEDAIYIVHAICQFAFDDLELVIDLHLGAAVNGINLAIYVLELHRSVDFHKVAKILAIEELAERNLYWSGSAFREGDVVGSGLVCLCQFWQVVVWAVLARNASVSSLTWISPRFCAFQSSSFLAMRATPSR